MNEIKTSVGCVQVEQTASNEIVITLSSAEQHPGTVTVNVINGTNGDTVKLLWIK